MKKLTKIAIISMICITPLAIFASSYENDSREYEYKERVSGKVFKDDDKYEHHRMYDRNSRDDVVYSKSNVRFEGRVEKRPAEKLNGVWMVSGHKLIVDDSTVIEFERNSIRIGDEVYVWAKRVKGEMKALKIEQDD